MCGYWSEAPFIWGMRVQYIDQFGGYESVDIDTHIAYFTDRLTGDEGLGDGTGSGGTGGNGTAGVTADTANVVIDWAWGQNEVVNNFDPDNGTIFIGWFNSGHIDVYEENGNVVFAVPSNNQTTTLAGISLAELSAANFTILDDTAAQEILALVGTTDNADPGDGGADTGDNDSDNGDTGGDNDGDAGGDNDGEGDTGGNSGGGAISGNGTAGVTKQTATVVITWAWGNDSVVTDFDPSSDTIFVDWFGPENIDVSEVGGNVVFSMPNNNQTVTLQGISLADLSAANFTIMHDQTAQEILAEIGSVGNGNGDTGSGNGDPDSGNGDAGDAGSGDGDAGNGDSGDNDNGDTGGGTAGGGAISGNGTAGVTKETATVVITWAWGMDRVVSDFDPSADTIFVDWFGPENIDVSEVGGNVVFSMPNNNQTVTLEGISLADLSAANFTIMHDQTAQEILSQVGGDANGGGSDGAGDNVGAFGIVYDNDGSDPPQTTGVTDAGGVKYRADYYADDIVNFDVDRDELDFGDTSVHNMITNKTPQGELIIDNPWWDDMQIVQGVQFNEFSIENFGIVGNEHFRQDIGGVLSWELGIGPRESDTVYIRSHEYGMHEVIDNFDPASMKISFLYYGTRERLSVEDTDNGLVISTQPSGQSFTFSGITLADLQPGTLEFHHDQVMEDRLEEPFGFDQNDVGLVSREALLTPEAPAGAITDGHQVREGVMSSSVSADNADDVFDFSALTVQGDGLSQAETELMFEELNGDGRRPAGRDGRREDQTEDDQDRSDTDWDGTSDGSDGLQDSLVPLSDQEIA